MENPERLFTLRCRFQDISTQLTDELAKKLPDNNVLIQCRKQLGQLDKDIRRIQIQKDFRTTLTEAK